MASDYAQDGKDGRDGHDGRDGRDGRKHSWLHNLGLVVVSAIMGGLFGNVLAFRSATEQIGAAKDALSSEINALKSSVAVLQAQQDSQANNAEQDRREILSAIDKLSDRVFADSAREYMTGSSRKGRDVDSGAGL